jgi:hypothetical protein
MYLVTYHLQGKERIRQFHSSSGSKSSTVASSPQLTLGEMGWARPLNKLAVYELLLGSTNYRVQSRRVHLRPEVVVRVPLLFKLCYSVLILQLFTEDVVAGSAHHS